jgi:hypothetical protein
MNFNLRARGDKFDNALMPKSIKADTDDWTKIEGYVYVISKMMPPYSGEEGHEDDKPLNCMKVGFARLGGTYEKGFERMNSFKTALITFRIHRIYLFGPNDFDQGKKEPLGENARRAEQLLHYMIDHKFKPEQVRITFSTESNTEWWEIKRRNMDKFLKFCDEVVENDTFAPPLYGTAFTQKTASEVPFVNRPEGKVGAYYTKKGEFKLKDTARATKSKHGSTERSVNTAIKVIQALEEEKKLTAKKRKEFTKTVTYWKDLLVGKKFTTKEKMYGGDKKYFAKNGKTTYVVTAVKYLPMWQQFMVFYEPDVRKARKYKKDGSETKEFEDAQGELPINEMLDEFPALKRKHMESWEYYVWFNGYDEDEDYTEEFQTAKSEKKRK